jgi:hypothetical protein
MKCLLCSSEIDDRREFPVMKGSQGQEIQDTLGMYNHVMSLGKWIHVTLTAQKSSGTEVLLSGHVCPSHVVSPGSLALAASPTPKKDKTS